MWKMIAILSCLLLVILAASIEEHDIVSDPNVYSTGSFPHCPHSSDLSWFSHLSMEPESRFEPYAPWWYRTLSGESPPYTSESVQFHTYIETLLGDNCPHSIDLIIALLLLKFHPGPFPRLTEIFSKTESKRIVFLYDRIQLLPIPRSYRDDLSDTLVAVINSDKVRQMFAGLRRHSQWTRTKPKLDADFARSSQDKLRVLLPDGLLDPFYHVQEINSDCSVESRFIEMGFADLLLSERVLELLAFCGIRIPLWNLMHFLPDISSEQLEAIFPFLSDFYVDQGDTEPSPRYLLKLLESKSPEEAVKVFHLPVVVDLYRSHLDDLADLNPESLQLMIDLNVPFLSDLLYHFFGLNRDTLLHVLCKHNQIDSIVLLASQYDRYVCEAMTMTNDNDLVPFYYLRWDSIFVLQESCPELVSLMFTSARSAFVIRRLKMDLSVTQESDLQTWQDSFKDWPDVMIRELSNPGQKSLAVLEICSRYVQLYHHLRHLVYKQISEGVCHQILNMIRSETNADIRSALMIQLAKHFRFPLISKRTSTNDIELQGILDEIKKRRQVLEYATRDKLQVLLVTEDESTLTRPDPTTGITALHNAFYHDDYYLVAKMLSFDNSDLNAADWTGTLPLQYASHWLIWRLVRDLPNSMMESVIKSHPFTFLYASYMVLLEGDYRYLHLLFDNLHLFDRCVALITTSNV